MTSPSPTQKAQDKRRGLRWLAYGGATLLVLLAAGLLFRQEIAGGLARAYLEGQDVEVGSLQVNRLTSDTIVLDALILGTEDEITAESIQLVFTPNLLSGRPTRVEIDSLTLQLDLTGNGPLLGSLQPLIDQHAAAPSDAPSEDNQFGAVPTVRLNGAEIVARTGAGPMVVDIEGGFGPQDDGSLTGRLSAQAMTDLGRLSAGISGHLGPDGALSVKARIDDGQIDWQEIAIGQLTGFLDVALTPDGKPQISADFKLADLIYRPADDQPLDLTAGTIAAEGGLSDFTLKATLAGKGESLQLDLAGGINETASLRQMVLAVEAELRTAGALAGYLPLPGVTVNKGGLTLVAEAAAALPRLLPWPTGWQDIPPLLQSATASFSGDVILADVALADRSSGLSAHLPFAANLQDNRLAISLREDGEARIEQPAAERLLSLGVPGDLLPLLQSGLSVSLASKGPQPFHLAMTPAWPIAAAELAAVASLTSEQGLSATVALDGDADLGGSGTITRFDATGTATAKAERLTLGDQKVRDLSLELPLNLRFGTEGLMLALAGDGKAGVRQLGGDLPLRLNKPLDLIIDQAELQQGLNDPSYRYRLRSRALSVDAGLEPAAGDPLAIALERAAVTVDGRFDPAQGHDATVEAKIDGIRIPSYALKADGLTTKTRLDRDLRPVESRFAAGPVVLGGDQPMLAPLTVDGTLRRRGSGYDITTNAALMEGPRLGELSTRYNDDGRAAARLTVAPLLFTPEGLQPSDVSGLLDGLMEVSGQVSGTAELAWPLNTAAERGTLGIQNLSFTSQGIKVEGISLDLALQSLVPLSSAADQRLTIRRIDAGAPIDNAELRFSLDQEPGPHLEIAGGGFRLAGADWTLEPTRLDPAASENAMVLATDNLDLAIFFALVEVDGLSGSGILAGRIPVVFEGDAVVVADGALAAQAPGRLSLRSPTLAAALGGGGKTVELAIKALEDFRYETLSIKLNKSARNEAQILLSILGSNPAVLDGQPFQFNINLESNLTSVLEALRQGYSLSDEALRRAWRLRE
ncbi:hypothetical protein HBA54_00800 [Pelagibius litoralis]|uniref:Dicarboxylate transport n=1 Tax=Pelagibius litoralis TaxID=374515 RepID=A0A967C2V1_9PROT|nr:YdbH domain-containing protein [Pelagibius litoralis]NIA67125.1 hypothetical protein [Pelagibius litoralis]